MNISFLSRRQLAARNLEKFYNNFLKDFNQKLSELKSGKMDQMSAEKLNRLVDDAEVRLKVEQAKYRQVELVDSIKSGKVFKDAFNDFKSWYTTKSPAVFVWADEKFTTVENFVEDNFSRTGDWVEKQLPAVKRVLDKNYSQIKEIKDELRSKTKTSYMRKAKKRSVKYRRGRFKKLTGRFY